MEKLVEEYFKEKQIENFMDYGSNRDSYSMHSLSNVYKDLLDKLNIKYTNIFTEDISDGKYQTTIEFDDNKIIVDTSAWNGKEVLKDNIESIKEKYEELQAESEDDMEM